MGLGLSNPTHILFIGLVLLLLFGAKRLPEMGRSLGTGIRDFRGALGGESSENPVAELVSAPSVTAAHASPAAPAMPATSAPAASAPAASQHS